jgi:two-component system OmpR family response regulator
MPAGSVDGDVGRLRFSGWCLDTAARHLCSPQGVVVPLSNGEYRLLHVLLTHPNRVLSRDQLLELTQGRDAEPFDRSIDVLVGRLRKRLEDTAREPQIIKTARGKGYVLAGRVTEE